MRNFKFNKNQPANGCHATTNRHSLTSGSDIPSDIMYPPAQPKIPPVRPRSSLSTDEHHHRYKSKNIHNKKRRSTTVFTLIGISVFLLILCAFLLAALVLIGRRMAIEKTVKAKPLSDEPAIRVQVDETMKASKILSLLSYRLPESIRPTGYNLYLNPNLKKKTFSGEVTINVTVSKPIQFIPVHVNGLEVETKEVSALSADGPARLIKPLMTFEHKQFEYWVTEFEKPLEEGTYAVKYAFSGNLTERITGFYQSSYKNATGDLRWIATSKFEPTYARQAFPCFDEPAMKAFFEVTLVRPTEGGYLALSNMDQIYQEEKGDVTEVTFAASEMMSTYLACFIVADFGYKSVEIEAPVGENFPLRVFATKAQVEKVTYALEVGALIIKDYISYFNLPYPLPKLDMAAIPDFVSGAMEHWGLVTYRETALLYDESVSSSANKQRVASVIAHELAHMWFGNLVTMKWWNDLWLNEGFASYIEYRGINAAHPEWKMEDQFIITDLHSVLTFDATLASHPIVQTVEKPSEITELFDSITYNKGASVIRMLEDFTTPNIFQQVVYNYLNRHIFANAESNDFWVEFEAFDLDYDVKLIMQTWTEQSGYPVVTVTKIAANQFKLTQKRFLSNPDDYDKTVEESAFNYRWSIPITYTTSANPVTQRTWYNYNDAELTIDLPSNVDWIKINKNQVGYYRVNYPDDVWNEIKNALVNTPTAFSVTDRAHLLDDAFALADATQLSFKTALDLTEFLSNEVEYVPWAVASQKLRVIKNLLYYTDAFRNYKTYASGLLNKVYNHVGWEVDANNHLNNLLRVDIINTACSLGHADCLREVGVRFTEWVNNPSTKPKPDLRSIIYRYGMWSVGDEEVWDKVWVLYKSETDASEKVKLMDGLTNIREPWILQRLIDLAWDEENVRSQDYFTCLQSISSNPIGTSIVWDHVRENWEKLVQRFGINERYLGRLIPGITKSFSTNQKLEELHTFFEKYPEAGAGAAARKEALSTVEYNINWLKMNKEQIASWLAANGRTVKGSR